jgi:hypothetical protein
MQQTKDINNEIQFVRMDMRKELASVQSSIDKRIATVVKSEVSKSEQMFQAQFQKTFNEQIELGNTLDTAQLTKLVTQLSGDIATIKNTSNNFLLGESMKNVFVEIEKINRRVSMISSQIDGLLSDKYVEIVEPSELKTLYSKASISPDEVGRYFNIDRSLVYNVINGKETKPNLQRRHKFKQFFLKKIMEKLSAS